MGEGRKRIIFPKAGKNLLWEAPSGQKNCVFVWSFKARKRQKRKRLERAAGALNNRRRPRRAGECTQAKCSHSRTRGPPSRPSVFTCLLSQVAQI